MKLADWVVIQTRYLCTDVRIDIWTFVCTHETHDNPPAKSLHRASPCVSANAFSHPLNHMTDLGVLETWMSVHQTLTLCDPKTFYSNSCLSHTLYDHPCSFLPIPVDILHIEKHSPKFKKVERRILRGRLGNPLYVRRLETSVLIVTLFVSVHFFGFYSDTNPIHIHQWM
jgi:hypothetical protein